MRCAIMQPTYMPWSGYFNLLYQVDRFVFLDDVQLSRPSWQTRNRILLQGRPFWIAVPARHGDLPQPINATMIDDSKPWRDKTLTLLRQTYARRPFADDMLEVAGIIGDRCLGNLAELNMKIIRFIANRLGLSPGFFRSSELAVSGQRSDKLAGICRKLGCDSYLSPPGAAEYLGEDRFAELSGIRLEFQDYQPLPYEQTPHHPFVSHLSVLDVLAHLGWEGARRYVCTGQGGIGAEG